MPSQPKPATYRILQWTFFPAMLLGLPLAIYGLLQQGVDTVIATYMVIAIGGLIYWAFEWLMPYRQAWNQPQGDLSNDVLSGTVAYILIPTVVKPLYFAALVGVAAWLAAQVGTDIWPTEWPLTLQVILLLLAGDAGRYWGHRLAHEWSFLWRFHAVHHSATRLWWWNATRQHPVDKLWFMASELIVPILLGVTGDVLALYLAVTAVCGFAQHCNIDLKLGPFYWLFNVVELHRWHHSKSTAESNNNYGNNLIVYDRLFGTYYHPEVQEREQQQATSAETNPPRAVGDIGLLNPHYPKSYWGQLLAPFSKGLDKHTNNAQPADQQKPKISA